MIAGEFEPDIALLERAGAFAKTHFPGIHESLRVEMWNHQRVYPSSWFIIVFKRVRAREIEDGITMNINPSKPFAYFNAILQSFLDQGGPGRGLETQYDDNMVRLRPNRKDAVNATIDDFINKLKGTNVE